jgi:hypothetical protein
VKRVTTGAPPEVLPLAVLRELATKYSDKGQGGGHGGQLETEAGGTNDPNGIRMHTIRRRQWGHQQSSMGSIDSRHWAHQVEEAGREELIRMETKRRAKEAFARAKQLWIWTAALAFSYVDLVTTVVVGLQYLNMGTAKGTRAADVTFAMLGFSLGVQTLCTHWTGMRFFFCTSIDFNA